MDPADLSAPVSLSQPLPLLPPGHLDFLPWEWSGPPTRWAIRLLCGVQVTVPGTLPRTQSVLPLLWRPSQTSAGRGDPRWALHPVPTSTPGSDRQLWSQQPSGEPGAGIVLFLRVLSI